MTPEKVIDLDEVYDLEQLAGSWLWKDGQWLLQWTWIRTEKEPYLVNCETKEVVRGLAETISFLKDNNIKLERP